MDDFVMVNLMESRNEWCHRLVSVLTPLVIEGIRSIFNESWNLCIQNNEMNKYLMTFQNLLSRIPKWNTVIVEDERKRIIERSGCPYLEDLITCVHIIQLKVLTSIRVGNKQKKIDISIPKLDHFVHKVYIHAARKIYMNVYLFEKNIDPLLTMKHSRELEVIVQETIMVAIRESIPTEAIIRAYMDESIEEEEIISIEPIPYIEDPAAAAAASSSAFSSSSSSASNPFEDPASASSFQDDSSSSSSSSSLPTLPSIRNLNDDDENVVTTTKLTFSDTDEVLLGDNTKQTMKAQTQLPPSSSSSSSFVDNDTFILPYEDLDSATSKNTSANTSSSSSSSPLLSFSLDDMIEVLP